ncbi:MAG: rod shape-determining protein RodA, partial [Zetaproteobacteria bacterium CG_4_8_14_3_um_filter_59_5]
MQAEGMAVQPAGEIVDGTGHHHLIVDGDCIAEGAAVPKDDTHMHFGKGQIETTLKLAPGEHT